ncbi:DUF4871 domain-containing protein [Fictibacillus barbaricus]|uniref:DUF4871 domain-containing protein n=1 Tax=Fictibacillus barbaricus TaxID=182136 RepID=A0ABU1U0D0_9BACL|nr:DUF4871 domain-containing protein [Fictibacillus barbaricus]MDR7072868.1 hypothetical protein [Fictibacillus barbaricus]
MKVKFSLLVFSMFCLIVSGCVSKKEETKDEKAQPVMQNDDSLSLVSEADLKNIEWEKTVTKIGTNGNSDIFGNLNKVGYVGPNLHAKKVDKWLWHFFGKAEGKLTVVAYHQETLMKKPLLTSGYTRDFSGGAMNGADATMPSNVSLPSSGKWALLVYIDEQLFDTLVISVKEKVTE